MSARLLHEAIDHAQAKPAARAGPFVVKNGSKARWRTSGRHASAGVGYRQRDIGAGQDIRERGGIVLIDLAGASR